ncbi:hypothetical protein IQ235_14880 [Oscillatoriales cyanobacterium LEGE 11467]|uniref:Uncharacterized protein n=1 Tax=Zarconia navalis LEGE 11467 TaxID=1828826 RepID=A0A928VZD6_9CYAN|nr:hypothetical protein [Zarconia navalis]MBE9042063.1 hypothetical protein [Zarconia navalis LEGE 11467]
MGEPILVRHIHLLTLPALVETSRASHKMAVASRLLISQLEVSSNRPMAIVIGERGKTSGDGSPEIGSRARNIG